MYDCPTCKVPLHDHEVECPNCGTKQRRRSVSKILGTQSRKPPVNVMPFVVVIMAVIIGFIVMAQSSWMGQLAHRGPKVEDPMDKLTYLDARNIVEQKLTEAITQGGGKCTFKWTRADAEVDKASEGPIELLCDAELADPTQRKAIVDPVKDYFAKAGIGTFNMDNKKTRAHWTYTVSPAPSDPSGGAAPEAAPAQ